MHPIYEKESGNKRNIDELPLGGADGNCCEAAARATLHRGCTVGAVGEGAADRGGRRSRRVLYYRSPKAGIVAAKEAKV
jgi:hypothetical protein